MIYYNEWTRKVQNNNWREKINKYKLAKTETYMIKSNNKVIHHQINHLHHKLKEQEFKEVNGRQMALHSTSE